MLMMKRQTGLSLIELMIGITIGLIIIAGVTSVYVATIGSSSDALAAARLNQELRAAMQVMTRDIRRAGFWGGAEPGDIDNPFTRDDTNLTVDGSSCILYTYDANNSGDIDYDNPGQWFGFTLTDDGAIGTLQGIAAGGTRTTADCSVWIFQRVTDPDFVTVTNLVFETDNYQCQNTTEATRNDCYNATPGDTSDDPVTDDYIVEGRQIDITIEAELANDPTVSASLATSVKVRNNRLYQQP